MNHLILVLTYNRLDLADTRVRELLSLYQGSQSVSFMLFDNGSTDPRSRLLRVSLLGQNILVAFAHENLGFARGFNAAVRAGRELVPNADVLHLLSDDVRVLGDFAFPVGQMLNVMPRAVVGHRVIDWPAGWNQFGPTLIAYPDGYYFGVRTEVWDELHGFDEDFTPHDYEDVDLGYRCKLAGIPLIAMDHLPLVHQPASTLGYTPQRRVQTLAMRRLFAGKHSLPLVPEEP